MFARYQKKRDGAQCSFQFIEQCSLFGCNAGLIPRLLRKQIKTIKPDPNHKWHLPIEAALGATEEYSASTLIIDLKPKQKENDLSLYEVLDVWGYSYSRWTPILLHLSGLFVDVAPNTVDRNKFVVSDVDRDGPIYEFLYLNGGISDGELTGHWTPPSASPTNGALLWPDALSFFFEAIQQRTPELFKDSGIRPAA